MAESTVRPAYSLRLRTALAASLTLLVSLGLVGLALDAAFRKSAESTLYQQLGSWAYTIMAGMEVDDDGLVTLAVEPVDPLLLQPDSGVMAGIRGTRNEWRSLSTLGMVEQELPALPAGETRFATPSDASPWFSRAFGLDWQLPDGRLTPVTISAQVHASYLEPQLQAFRGGLWRSLGAAAVLLVLAQLALTAIILRPLRQVAEDVARVEAGQSDRLGGPFPRELEPLTRNIDRLLQTEQANQDRYRNALDSLAHSLKTPLAVLRAGLPDSSADDDEPLRAQRQAVDDMQLLIATRLERAAAGTRRTLAAPVAVAPVAERLARALRKVHSQHLRTLTLTIPPDLNFYGEERDLLELLGNLLENACKYGAGEVHCSARQEGGGHRPGLRLVVENDGDYVDLNAYVQRGRRGDERAEGHGLGLTIVSEVASIYGGDLAFARGKLGGPRVTVTLPPAGV